MQWFMCVCVCVCVCVCACATLAMEFHEKLQSLAAKEGLKGRKVSRALESFSWNITILKVSNTHTHSHTHTHTHTHSQPQELDNYNLFWPEAVLLISLLFHPPSLPPLPPPVLPPSLLFLPLSSLPPSSSSPCPPSWSLPLFISLLPPRARPTSWSGPRLKSRRTRSRSTTRLWPETSARRVRGWRGSAPRREGARTTKPPRVLEEPRHSKWLREDPRPHLCWGCCDKPFKCLGFIKLQELNSKYPVFFKRRKLMNVTLPKDVRGRCEEAGR